MGPYTYGLDVRRYIQSWFTIQKICFRGYPPSVRAKPLHFVHLRSIQPIVIRRMCFYSGRNWYNEGGIANWFRSIIDSEGVLGGAIRVLWVLTNHDRFADEGRTQVQAGSNKKTMPYRLCWIGKRAVSVGDVGVMGLYLRYIWTKVP